MTTEISTTTTNSSIDIQHHGASSVQQPRHVSIFADPVRLQSMIEAAKLMSQAQFVPQAFRNKPADCLVILDTAERIGADPIALCQHIYIIDAKPSYSSQFLISLVNNSGRFSRIEYEEGVDGEADVTVSVWGNQRGERKKEERKVPNYYAVARFVERSTGREFSSPRVDIKFADRSGWVGKPESMWVKSPEIMCRYRAASILIKSVCPELTLGLEWADDVRDAREEPRTVDVESRPTPRNTPRAIAASECDVDAEKARAEQLTNFMNRIAVAKDDAELRSVAELISRAKLPPNAVKILREAYGNRQKELSVAAARVPGEAFIKPGEAIISELGLINAVNNAADVMALEAVRDAVSLYTDEGRIDSDVAIRVYHAIDERSAELEDSDVEDEDIVE